LSQEFSSDLLLVVWGRHGIHAAKFVSLLVQIQRIHHRRPHDSVSARSAREVLRPGAALLLKLRREHRQAPDAGEAGAIVAVEFVLHEVHDCFQRDLDFFWVHGISLRFDTESATEFHLQKLGEERDGK